jgi:sRNA-binding protein
VHPALRALLTEELEEQRKVEAQRALEEEARRKREEAARKRQEEEARREAEAARHREAVEAQRRQQEAARRQQEVERAIRRQAEEWLAKLDPYSIEGQWFTVFAARHKDKLSAAIAYLREVKGLG